MLFSLGLALDLLLGDKKLLGRLPGLDVPFILLSRFFIIRLDRANRSRSALRTRAVIILLLFVPVFFALGYLVNNLALRGDFGPPLAALMVARAIRLRDAWHDAALAASVAGTSKNKLKADDSGQYAAAQLVLRYSRDLMANLVLFAIGGFALLLPFRFLAAAAGQMADQSPYRGAAMPQSVFKRPFFRLYDLMALPGALVAAFLLALAPIFVPGTRLLAIRGIFATRFHGLISNSVVLNSAAFALTFAFRFDPLASRGITGWLGPKDGRARQGAPEIRKTGFLVLAATALTILLLVMTQAGLRAMMNV